MAFRALAVDLDGTLLGPDGAVSERNRRALRAAREAGWRVVLATARWFQLAERTASHLELAAGPVVACSGAEVRRLVDGTDLMDVRLPAGFAAALYELCDDARAAAWVVLDREVLLRTDDGTAPPPGLAPEVRPVARLAAATAAAGLPRIVLVQGGARTHRAILGALRDEWSDRVRFLGALSSRGEPFLTLTGAGADKGVALGVACADLGLALSEVVAIGDAEIDVEMFRVAGASFAMGQAAAAVKAAATAVTASNADDGVAAAVERLLAEGDGAFA